MLKLQKDLLNLYGKKQYEFQLDRYEKLGNKFKEKYGEYSFFVSSPGRIEICGNHTDHNHGRALASSIDLDTIGAVRLEKNGKIIIDSIGYDIVNVDVADLALKENEKGTSTALTKGILKYLSDKGYVVGGFTVMSESRVFKGAGVSSSASFEILVAKIVSVLFNDDEIPAEILVQSAHYAESVYFGKPCGLLDQTAIGMGGISYIDFNDPDHPTVENIVPKLKDFTIMLINTGGDHSNLTDAYADVRKEMEQIASYFGQNYLRDVEREEFLNALPKLCEKFSGRAIMRAEHFFAENERVDSAKSALLAGDDEKFYSAINQSGESSYKLLQNCYVEGDRAQRIPLALCVAGMQSGVIAKRVHGGGFAGTVILFVNNEKVKEVKEKMTSIFQKDNVYCLNIRTVGAVKLG